MKYIITPNPSAPNNLRQISLPYNSRSRTFASEDAMIEHVVTRSKATGLIGADAPHYVVDESALPNDHYFFDAWEWVDGAVAVSMAKARVINMNKIRISRDAELVDKDIAFMRAIEAGDTDAQGTIRAEKQALRDIPQNFDITTGVDTPEQLKAKWPDGLPTLPDPALT